MSDIVALCMNPSIDVSTSVERIIPIRKLRCTAAKRDPGGGGVNVARVVRRFGSEVGVIYPSGGSTGQLLHRLVQREGVAGLAVPAEGETREDFTVLEQTTGAQFRFVLPGPRLAAHEWRSCLELLRSVDTRPKFIVASGSLPAGVPEDFYARVARIAKKIDVKFVLDTSGEPLRAALREGVYLIKPNLQELSDLGHTPLEGEDIWVGASRTLVDGGGAEIVALTLGHKGALLVTRERFWRAPALPIKAISTVGAGDSFLGGMVWALASGHDLPTAFRFANAAGSAAVLAPGTELCRWADVERLFEQIVLRSGIDRRSTATGTSLRLQAVH